MLPISDVQFAFCGIATVAATLGYACARRSVFSLASPSEPSKADVEAGPPEERSLKRKLDDADEHDVDAEEQSRPIKRNKTPPVDQHDPDEDEWEVVVAPPPPYEQAVGLQPLEDPAQDNSAPPQEHLPTVEKAVASVEEPVPPALPKTSAVETRHCSTPQPPTVNPSPNESETPPARPVTPPKPVAPTKAEATTPFSAFSGSSSPFASYTKTPGPSSFALSGQSIRTAPAWRRDSGTGSNAFGQASPLDALALSPNDMVPPATTTPFTISQSKNALEAPQEAQSIAKPSSYLTGEEDETVEAELKGVKLFVKRGQKEFTDGMYGHIKVLTQKSAPKCDPQEAGTETNTRTRLLFRRDPLGQVSMNVGLRPTVRCHFDSAENILRVILMEQTTTDGKSSKEDVTIYALKPGRAQKTDFQSFTKALCDHEGLKARTVTSSGSPATGDAAAS